MGVFGKSKKVKEAKEAQAEGLMRSDTQNAPSKMSRSLKRKQKNIPEPEPVTVPLALPDNNDFRTSLILPGLSARFSMLREQNDPNTKIGKANDDSVLFPSRASRLNLFQHNPLTDIAEVESIYSFRPPFAGNDRSNSISSGYASDDGSIMNRTKPGDGNNLFSGRQKLYRVPQGTSSNTTPSEGRALGGRHVYSNDVTAAMFRSTSRIDGQSADELTACPPENMAGTEQDENEHVPSPSTPFSKNRGTTSSTTSAPSNGRTSTAATSIASESPAVRENNSSTTNLISRDLSNGSSERVNLQKRPNPQTFDYQTPHLHPVNDIVGPPASRTQNGPRHSHKLSQSRSMITLKELNVPQQNVFTSSTIRPQSPPLTAPLTAPLRSHKDTAAREDTRSPSPLYRAISPTAGMGEPDGLLTYNSSVQPGDRGKATALGLFNKPQRQFDEQQYSQRQMQMHEGRISPPNRAVSSERESRATSPEPTTMFQPDLVEAGRNPVEQSARSSQASAAWPIVSGRPRTKSSASTAKSALIEARTNSLIRRQNEELANLETQRNFSAPLQAERRRGSQKSQKSITRSPMIKGTFFDAQGGSEDESESASPAKGRHNNQTRQQSKDVHPALRDGLNEFIFDDSFTSPKLTVPRSPFQTSHFSEDPPSISREQDLPTLIPSSENLAEDSRTLPAPGLGLSGLVRSHMRTDSDKSSLYPLPADAPQSGSQEAPRKVSTSTERTLNPPESIRSDPWELDNDGGDSESPTEGAGSTAQATLMSQKARQILGQARALNSQSRGKAQQVLGDDAPDADVPAFNDTHPLAPWLEDRRPSHRRESSSLTQKEDQELEEEMAERRRRIQQRLGGVVDSEGRSMSPAPTFGRNPNKSPYMPGYPLPDQRHNQPGPDGQYDQRAPKAMKMLGIQDPPPRRRPSPRTPHDELWKDEEEQMLRDYGRRPKPRSMPVEDDFNRSADRPIPAAGMRSGSAEEIERSRQRSATPNSGNRGQGRPRPNQEYGNRSRSRPGNREEDERMYGRPHEAGGRQYGYSRSPHEEPYNRGPSRGPGDRAQSRGPSDRAPSRGTTDPRPYERSASASSGRYRSNSRPGAPPHMDNRPPPVMPQANNNMPFRPARPAPPPILSQDGPMSPHLPQRQFDASSSPPSAVNSPTVAAHGMASNGRTTPTSTGQNFTSRKKSVTKNMISEPTFLSSTSSVPLVGLEDASSNLANLDNALNSSSPPIPVMNPRRRHQIDINNPTSELNSASGPPPHNPFQYLRPDLRPGGMRDFSSPLPISPISAGKYGALSSGEEHTLSDDNAIRAPRQRNRLRKTSSEGGSMAAKARNQAMLGELRNERVRSPAVPTFGSQGPTPVRMGHMNMGGVGGGMMAGSRGDRGQEMGMGGIRGPREGEMF